jgi:signal transduction histidine kinase
MRRFIFIWFLASVFLVGIISAIGAWWSGRSIRLAAWSFYESNFVHYTAQTIARALDNGGVPALKAMERNIDPEGKMRFFVFDSGLNEVSGDVAPASIRALAGRLRPQDSAQFLTLGSGLVAGSMAAAHNGVYRVIVWFPARRVGYVPINAWGWTGRIAAIVAAAGILCSWLAWQLSTPLARLREAARRYASGDLKARAGVMNFPSTLPEYQDLARDFDEMAGRIETLVDSQRQLLRDVSHELRTPLTRLNLAVNNARHAPESAIDSSLDRIEIESERLNALIDRILHLSRVEAFTAPPRRDLIELADFLETIVSDADFEAAARKRRVSIVRAGKCRLAGDRELLREAIENIVRNAIRYTPEGTAVTVDAGQEGPAQYRIAIRDCGPGVRAEHLGSIFDPFYRAPQCADAESSTGFGIGLAIAKRAVSLHHGTITASNRAESGFEVVIRLPVAAT